MLAKDIKPGAVMNYQDSPVLIESVKVQLLQYNLLNGIVAQQFGDQAISLFRVNASHIVATKRSNGGRGDSKLLNSH